MRIEITDRKTLGDISQKFTECFPYLKLEFYAEPHHLHELSLETSHLPLTLTVEKVRKQHEHDVMEIFSYSKVKDVESAFKDRFGLFVQIMRKNGDDWYQTAQSDDLSLSEVQKVSQLRSINKITK